MSMSNNYDQRLLIPQRGYLEFWSCKFVKKKFIKNLFHAKLNLKLEKILIFKNIFFFIFKISHLPCFCPNSSLVIFMPTSLYLSNITTNAQAPVNLLSQLFALGITLSNVGLLSRSAFVSAYLCRSKCE